MKALPARGRDDDYDDHRHYPPAIVLSDNRGGLGAARSLWRKGVHITAIVWDASDLLLRSRAVARKIVIPGGNDRAKEANLLRILDSCGVGRPVMITSSDRMVEFIARHRERPVSELSLQYSVDGLAAIA